MELCTSHHVINFLNQFPKASFLNRPVSISPTLSPSLSKTSPANSELRFRKLFLRAISDESSNRSIEYAQGTQDVGLNFEDASPVEENSEVQAMERENVKEEYVAEDQSVTFELLDKLDVKLDTDSTIPILLYGGGAIVSIWLASAVVEAVDAIPVFPKLMQVVGIAYTVWFTSRYLIFKESRDELSTKIAELKLKIFGFEWN